GALGALENRGSGTEDRCRQGRGGRSAFGRRVAQDARLLARRQLPVRRPDLPDGQPAPEGAVAAEARQAAPARALGHHVGPELPLRPPEPGHQGVRPEHALHLRPRARGAGAGRQRLPGGDILSDMAKPRHVQGLETWTKSYKPEELFDETGRLLPELAELAPKGEKRMSANPHTNGGALLKDLKMPVFRDYAVD